MKRRMIFFLLVLMAAAAIGTYSTTAIQRQEQGQGQTASQPVLTPGAPAAVLRRDFKDSMPLPPGERLEYDIRISKFPVYLSVGTFTLEYIGPVENKAPGADQTAAKPAEPLLKGLNTTFVPSPSDRFLHLRATAVSKGLLLKIFGYSVQNRYETLVDNNDFSARLSLFEEKVGKRNRVQTAVFDRSTQLVKYLTSDLNKPNVPPQAKDLPLQDGMMSLLSGLYYLRLQDYKSLKEGQMMRIPVTDDQKNYEFEILVGKREKVKTECGQIDTIKLEPKIFGKDKFFRKEGEMSIWLTDNEQRVPVHLEARGEAGKISVKLIKKTCKLLDLDADEEEKEKKKK
jgi:Protein of unknown function (DUF3108)